MRDTVNAQRLSALARGVTPLFPLYLDESLPIDPGERSQWQRRLNGYRSSCGCAEGAAGLGVGLVVVAVGWYLHPLPFTAANLGGAVAVSLGCLIAGKLAGLRLDRIRFRMTCRQLLRRLELRVEEASDGELR